MSKTKDDSQADADRCSFCGQVVADSAMLFVKGAGRICSDCVEMASAILEERRLHPSTAGSGAYIDISVYEVDHEIAAVVTHETMREHRFVPLRLYAGTVVIAVAELEQAERIAELVKKAMKEAGKWKDQEFNFLWATPGDVSAKIKASDGPASA